MKEYQIKKYIAERILEHEAKQFHIMRSSVAVMADVIGVIGTVIVCWILAPRLTGSFDLLELAGFLAISCIPLALGWYLELRIMSCSGDEKNE